MLVRSLLAVSAATLFAGAALAQERVAFRSPKEIGDGALACLRAAKNLSTHPERRAARNKCLADRRKALSEYRTNKQKHKLQRSAYKARVKATLAACKSAGRKLDPAKVRAWEAGLQAWTQQIDRYLKQGGERPVATPPELTADVCK